MLKKIWSASRLHELIEGHNGKLSSTRVKSFGAFFLVVFMIFYGVLAEVSMDINFIITLLGYGFIETGSEKLKDASISRHYKGNSGDTNS